MISDRLVEDMKAAMKSGEKTRLSVIRMLRSELKNAQIEAGGELSEADEQKVVAGYARKRKEAWEQYEESGHAEMAAKEKAEYDITTTYLPPPLDEAGVTAIVRAAIEKTGAQGLKDMGRVMKPVMDEVAGRADGATVSAIVRKLLSS